MGNAIVTTALSSLLFLSPQPTTPPTPTSVTSWESLRPTVYVVQKGDSLATIAQSVYGDSDYWTVLWKDNAWIDNPKVIYSEWKLTLRPEKPHTIETVLPANLKAKIVAAQATEAEMMQTEYMPAAKSSAQTRTVASEPRPSNYDAVYQAAGEKYGVPWQVLYGLHLTETGLRGSGEIYNQQGSGATGPMQFMPGTWRAYGVDGDGDGQANIYDVEDAIYGAANYLQKHGSIQQGLRAYGGNQSKTMQAAIKRGYNPNTN